MKTEEVGIKPSLRIVLKSDAELLDEVVVTAIGIQRSEKSLGYSVSNVKGDEITKARETNIVNSLSGKIAGVRVGQSSGTAGGSSSIQIRGASSIGSVSSPLFIIDGLPIDNGSYNPDTTNGIVDVGNRAGDISSDDVESINVLKGAAATALYGARAKDGAIVITTKKGSKASKTTVTVNSSVRFDNVAKLPDFQNEYAQGSYGVYSVKMLNGWGPNIASVQDQKFTDFKGDEVTLKANPDNVKDFYDTGVSYINNVSMAGGKESSDFRVSVSTHNQKGVVPGSDYNKYAFTFNGGMDFTNKFSARVSAQYIRSDSEGRPAQGANDNNLLIPMVNGMPRTVSIKDVKNNWIDEYGDQITLDPDGKSNNPYWLINKNKFTNALDRVIGNVILTYKPFEFLTISNNAGIDFYNESRRKVYAKGTVGNLDGKFQTWDLYNRVLNNDLMITFDKRFDDFGIKAIVGHNIYQKEWKRESILAQSLVVDGLYTYTNAKTTSPVNFSSLKRLVGVYADIGFSYKDMFYMNVTGRNDWSSTLPINNRSYFYPSVSASFIFTELMENKDILSFGKIRANYANVGSDEEPYQLAFQYTAVNTYFLQYGLENIFPHNGLVGFTGPRTLPNANLKPQNQSSFEIGTDLRFLNNRIRLDLTYYSSVTKNQIVAIDVPLSTGYFVNNINAGKVTNKGVEIALGVTPIQNRNFNWDIDVNFAHNKQVVKELTGASDNEEYSLTSGLSGLQIKAQKGKSFGLYGKGWKRDDKGNYVINEKTGLRETVNNVRLGDVAPDFTMGINNTFSYKGFTLSFLIDIRQGGHLYSETISSLRTSGLAAETVANRENTFIEPGVIMQADGTFRPNDVPVASMQDYWAHIAKSDNNEGNIFNASYIKLREVQLSYSLPKSLFRNWFVNSIDVGFEARNLWIIKDHLPHIDPESNFFGPSQIGGAVEFNSIPTTRSFGFNVRLTL